MKKQRKPRIFHLLMAIAATCSIAVSVTACGAKHSSMDMVAETAAAAMQEGGFRASGGMGSVSGSSINSMEYAVEEAAFDVAASGSVTSDAIVKMEAPAPSGTDPGSAVPQALSNRKLIRTVNLSVETTEFDQMITELSQNITALGGYLEQSDISGTSISSSEKQRRHAYFTARIPAARLDGFITQIGDLGNITNKSESIQDITLQYSDIESHKKSLTIEQERLWELLEKADTMEAIIALEERLSEVRYQLESYESRLRTYDNQVDYSTVYLDVREVKVLTPTEPDSVFTRIEKGFTRSLHTVANGLVDFFVWFLSNIPALTLMAVILTAAIMAGKAIVRRKSRKNTKLAADPNSKTEKRRWFSHNKTDHQDKSSS